MVFPNVYELLAEFISSTGQLQAMLFLLELFFVKSAYDQVSKLPDICIQTAAVVFLLYELCKMLLVYETNQISTRRKYVPD
jgi:hypothetical protein